MITLDVVSAINPITKRFKAYLKQTQYDSGGIIIIFNNKNVISKNTTLNSLSMSQNNMFLF